MPAPSTVKRLPKELQDAIAAALDEGRSFDDIVQLVRDGGGEVSRSAIGRHAINYREVVDAARRRREHVADLVERMGDQEADQVKFLFQLGTSAGIDALINFNAEGAVPLDPGQFEKVGKGLNQFASAVKTNEHILELRDKRTRAQAADRAEDAVRAAGAAEDTIAVIRAAIMDEAA